MLNRFIMYKISTLFQSTVSIFYEYICPESCLNWLKHVESIPSIISRCLRICAQITHVHESFIPYSQSYPHDLPRITSLSPTGGGWLALRQFSRVKWLWHHRQTHRNGNVVRLDSFNLLMITAEKIHFATSRRKIMKIYCPLVTEKSTNPRVKITFPCLCRPQHGLS